MKIDICACVVHVERQLVEYDADACEKKNKRRINTTFLLIENVSGDAFICLWEWVGFSKGTPPYHVRRAVKMYSSSEQKNTIYPVDYYYYCRTIPLELRTPEVSA